MSFRIPTLILILIGACTSQVVSVRPAADASAEAGSDGGGAALDAAPEAPEVGAEPTDSVGWGLDIAAPQDIVGADVQRLDASPPTTDVLTADAAKDKCTCDTAAEIVFRKDISHSSCKTPSPSKYLEICHSAKSQLFKDGATFGVSGCKFRVTCP